MQFYHKTTFDISHNGHRHYEFWSLSIEDILFLLQNVNMTPRFGPILHLQALKCMDALSTIALGTEAKYLPNTFEDDHKAL